MPAPKCKAMKVCCHSSKDQSIPTVLPSHVRVPSTPCMLFSYIVKFVLYWRLHCETDENRQKEAGVGPYSKIVFYFSKKLLLLLLQLRRKTEFENYDKVLPQMLYKIDSSGQSYEQYMIVIYESRVVIWGNLRA